MQGIISLCLLGFSNNVAAGEVKSLSYWDMGSFMGSVSTVEETKSWKPDL